jgi:hypothetical protein
MRLPKKALIAVLGPTRHMRRRIHGPNTETHSCGIHECQKRPSILIKETYTTLIPEKLLIAVLGPIRKTAVASRRLGVQVHHDARVTLPIRDTLDVVHCLARLCAVIRGLTACSRVLRRRMHACHMRRRIHACHMRRRIHACKSERASL